MTDTLNDGIDSTGTVRYLRTRCTKCTVFLSSK